jgi:hypothetical protein
LNVGKRGWDAEAESVGSGDGATPSGINSAGGEIASGDEESDPFGNGYSNGGESRRNGVPTISVEGEWSDIPVSVRLADICESGSDGPSACTKRRDQRRMVQMIYTTCLFCRRGANDVVIDYEIIDITPGLWRRLHNSIVLCIRSGVFRRHCGLQRRGSRINTVTVHRGRRNCQKDPDAGKHT